MLEREKIVGRVEPDLHPGRFFEQRLQQIPVPDGQRIHDVAAAAVVELDQRDMDAVAVEVVLPLHVDREPCVTRVAQAGKESFELTLGLYEIVAGSCGSFLHAASYHLAAFTS